MALREGYLKLGGLTLHHTYGGMGRPIVFVHGLGSSGYIEWRFNLEHFARGNRVFAPDPLPNSTTSGASCIAPAIFRACFWITRLSARVTPYSGNCVMASNRADPAAS